MIGQRLRTAESVAAGHPDKLADRIVDEILDAALTSDPQARVAAEAALSHRSLTLLGEISLDGALDLPAAIARAILSTGWCQERWPLTFEEQRIEIAQQSREIARGIERSEASDRYDQLGAGDQGSVIGYATDEHPSLIPAPLFYAHQLMRAHHDRVLDGRSLLGPDAKAQVSVSYQPDGKPQAIETIVISSMHRAGITHDQLVSEVSEHLLNTLPQELVTAGARIMINPAGSWTVGGPAADSGLSGRKLAVDSYGGIGRHGGGAWSGKDPSKVDRSGAYAARQAAVSLIRSGLAREVEVSISYAIGIARPVAVSVDSFGSGALPDERLAALISEKIDLRPQAIIEHLDLRRPIYAMLASFGQVGRLDYLLPWERAVEL